MAGVRSPPTQASIPRLGVMCTGLEYIEGHWEYIFHVSHTCGCGWTVQRRYSELLEWHKQLSNMLDNLPPFPPKRSMSQIFTSSMQEVASTRVPLLQRYLEVVAASPGAAKVPAILEMLGAGPPDAVATVRPARWRIHGAAGATCELEVRPGWHQKESCCRPVEGFEVEAQLLPSPGSGAAGGGRARRTIVRLGEPVCITGLPCGVEVEFGVRAKNALGSSSVVSIRVFVPWGNEGSGGGASSGTTNLQDPVASEDMRGDEAHDADNASFVPFKGPERFVPGNRVVAVWAGDGQWYDGVVRHVRTKGWVTVDWLRPAPLSEEVLRCVCDAGGDDTAHREVPVCDVISRLEWERQQLLAKKKSGIANPPRALAERDPLPMEGTVVRC
eukprot:gnl/TRDRNA2_/TRDRNA2_191167_c0_seq1.p1 gnl/TRDRNA2_/TRDRNA2_191167_c0~~gnl/TRDRNA2_/TRDRNA2_191167_c0_seq1.p1  ORF type:complete len:386 (+),score=56.54 gnl/TRDRNA2_/TRDRNA2_191167_c0_seq1:118-1275(+)